MPSHARGEGWDNELTTRCPRQHQHGVHTLLIDTSMAYAQYIIRKKYTNTNMTKHTLTPGTRIIRKTYTHQQHDHTHTYT